jgi:hypothetical protein
VPLTSDPLALEPTPRAATDARRWVADVCRQLGREDLVECAELGVTELVTNAVLHARPPLNVRVRGTTAHPRIDVIDGSTDLPVPPAEDDDVLTTFGRGLTMVAMSSTAWGASVEPDGKIVWFEPSPSLGEAQPDGVFDASRPSPSAPPVDAVSVRLIGLDPALHASVLLHFRELRRELRLLSLAHEEDYPLAASLTETFERGEHLFPAAPHVAPGEDSVEVDLELRVDPDAGSVFESMIEMFDLADAFCRAQRLLSLQRTPVQRAYQTWYLNQILHQIADQSPTPWPGHVDDEDDSRVDHAS